MMRPIVVMIAWKRMLTEGSTMKSVAYYPCKPIMSQTPIKQFAPTWHCFSVRYFHTYVKIYFLSFLHHEDTEKKLHDITYEGMSTRSGCKPSCEEWTYNAVQQSYSRESMYKANTIYVLYITQIAMMWWPTTSKNILDKIYVNQTSWLFSEFAFGYFSDLQVVSAINWTPPYIYTVIRTSEIVVEEEYMVYDFNGIVGTVGGSLGLFVGFSFLQCMLYILGSLHNKSKKWCKSQQVASLWTVWMVYCQHLVV